MKRVLFICGKARKRSPTAAQVMREWPDIEADFAGLSKDADVLVTSEHLEWADVIMVMENRQKKRLASLIGPLPPNIAVIALDIPDRYEFMDPELADLLMRKLCHHFGPPDRV